MQALSAALSYRTEELHAQELGIATLTACFINANRDPKSGSPAKPEDFFYFKPTHEQKINAAAVETFFQLVAEEKMPSWAVAVAPIEELRNARITGTPVPQPRAWICKGVLLLQPKLMTGKLISAIALINTSVVRRSSELTLIDIDTGVTRTVSLPETNSSFVLDFSC